MKKKIVLLVASALLVMLVFGCPNESTKPGLNTGLWALANGTWVDSYTPTDLAIIDAETIFAIANEDEVYDLTIDGHIKGEVTGSLDTNKSGSIYLTVTDKAVPASAVPVKSVQLRIINSVLTRVEFYSDDDATISVGGEVTASRKITDYAAEMKIPAGTYTRAAKPSDNPPVLEESIVVTAAVAGTSETLGTPATVKIGADAAAKVYAGYRSTSTASIIPLVTEKGVMTFYVPTGIATVTTIESYTNVGTSAVRVYGPYPKIN